MSSSWIGYARCSTDQQDLTAQRHRVHELGVPTDRITSITDSPVPTANAPAWIEPSPPSAPATLW